jgi:hypothetical protein
LCSADVNVAHLFRDFAPQPRAIAMAARRRDVEPLVRLHQVDGDPRAGRVNHAERKAFIRIRRFGAMCTCKSDISHYGLPFCARRAYFPSVAPSGIPVIRVTGQARSSAENLNDSLNVAMNRM